METTNALARAILLGSLVCALTGSAMQLIAYVAAWQHDQAKS